MADMTRHLKRWLTDTALVEMGGKFDDVIASVTDEEIRNRFTAVKAIEPVVTFDQSGYRLVLNKGMLQSLIALFGPESNDWIGRRVYVFRRRLESKHGETRARWQRAIACEDRHARVAVQGRWPLAGRGGPAALSHEREPGEDDEPPVAVDDASEALTAEEIFGERRRSR